METVSITEELFEKFKEKVSDSSQFTVEYEYYPQSDELFRLILKTEDYRLDLYDKKYRNSIEITEVIKENEEWKRTVKEIENAKFSDDSLFTIERVIRRSLNSEYQCVLDLTTPSDDSGDRLIKYCIFSSKK